MVHEAQNWLSGFKFKSRLDVQSLQTKLLHLLARESIGAGQEPIRISSGTLLQKAVHMGLHKDPITLPVQTTYATEMRRRLWNTILEMSLESSLNFGGPPFISLDDFDTDYPSKFNDDDLTTQSALPKQEDQFTQMSTAIALRKTLPVRLAVTKFLNDLKSHITYEEMPRLDSELRKLYKAACQTLRKCRSTTEPSPSTFETRVVDFVMHRYSLALHVPFFGLALQCTTYAYSRKVVIESSLKCWCAAYPSSSIMATQTKSATISSNRDDWSGLGVCSFGFSSANALQSAILIAVELRVQLQENGVLNPLPLRPDLLIVLDESKRWCLEAIKAGEINVKGYLLMSVLATQIEGLMRGVTEENIPGLVIKAAEDAVEVCLPILEDIAAKGTKSGLYDTSPATPQEAMEDWDFTVRKTHFQSPFY